MYNCQCVRCKKDFVGRYPKSKICKACSRRGMPRGEAHWNYKEGRFTYETYRGELRAAIRYCEDCGADLLAAGQYEWCIHHIDHDHYNHERSNLKLLCKRCHQMEHNCHLAFEGATTIPKGSRAKRPEAVSTPRG